MVDFKIFIVTQARVGSSRFPKKVLKKIGKETMLSLHLKRLQKSKLATKIIVATTHEIGADKIISISEKLGVSSFQGSTQDVLDRFYKSVVNEKPDFIVRVTSDCPLIDPSLVDNVIEMTINNKLDYGANILKEEFPDGQDVEVFTFNALKKAWEEATLPSDREHVTPYIRKNSSFNQGQLFESKNFDAPNNFNHLRMTVDEPADLETIKILIDKLGDNETWETYSEYIIQNNSKLKSQSIVRNEGYLKSLNKDNL